jgi:hypothetical protein
MWCGVLLLDIEIDIRPKVPSIKDPQLPSFHNQRQEDVKGVVDS